MPAEDALDNSKLNTFVEVDRQNELVVITTPAGNKIVFSDNAKGIELRDQNDNSIKLSPSGIEITSAKDLTVTANNIRFKSQTGVSIVATADVEVTGLNIALSAQVGATVKGSATTELSASGQTTVKGAIVMIN